MKTSLHKKILGSLAGLILVAATSGCMCDDDECADPNTSWSEEAPSGSPQADEAVDSLIENLCITAVRCDARLNVPSCISALNGGDGRQIWDNFGLKENPTTDQVRQGLSHGTITLNAEALKDCLGEFGEVCDNAGESFSIGGYANVENLVWEEGACPSVFNSFEEGAL